MINVYGTYPQGRYRKESQTSKQRERGPWKKITYTLVQCYSKCGSPPGADPQTVIGLQ